MWDDVKKLASSNENVWKFVFTREGSAPSAAVAEAVLYKYPTFEARTVICCSTMSGCPVGCRFCGAGDAFVRALSADEIYEQVSYLLSQTHVPVPSIERLQIMFMSMGEPMLNFVQLRKAIRKMAQHWPKAKLLISSVGPRNVGGWAALRELSQEIPTIGLQFSVHESTDEARDKLIPYQDKMNLQEIALEGQRWALATGRRPFFNYCVHARNDSAQDADRLVALFTPKLWEATISVVCERDEHVAAANARQRELAAGFMQKLATRGFSTRMFDPAGQDDIGGGCGQLWFVQDWMAKHPGQARPSCGAGLPKVHTPEPEENEDGGYDDRDPPRVWAKGELE